VASAESDPATSVVTRVPAGCNPVRVTTSANGSVVWVTARASDALLAFSAARLQASPRSALLADVAVGEAPVGLALVRDGSLIVVADSNRFDVSGQHASLAVVDVRAALAGRPALLGYLPAGAFPRDVAANPSGSAVLVANFASSQVESVNVAGLP
jgi:DNA-binding beta-propeller fold protein YncE